jgi:hypothetical protein
MKRERFDLIADPAPRMSGAARADVEALRASDRLQQIFESDVRAPARARPAPPTDAAASAHADGGSEGRRRWPLASRRGRLLVGLVPLYLAAAVLTVEGLSALRDRPDPIMSAVADGEAARPGRVVPNTARDPAPADGARAVGALADAAPGNDAQDRPVTPPGSPVRRARPA